MDIDTLLADAELIAAFGMRSGILKQDAPLYGAIEKAEAKRATGALSWGTPEATALAKAMAAAAEAIAPVTLIDLRSDWDPFDDRKPAPVAGQTPPPPKSRLRWWLTEGKTQFACLVATVLLIYAAGYYTIWHGRATELMEFGLADSVDQQRAAVRRLMLPLLVAPPAAEATSDVKTASAEVATASTDATKAAELAQAAPAAPTATTAPEAARLTLLLDSIEQVDEFEAAIDQYRIRFDALFRDRIIGRGQYLDMREHFTEKAVPTSPDLATRLQQVRDSCRPELQAKVHQALLKANEGGVPAAGPGFVELAALENCLLEALDVSPPSLGAEDWEQQRYSFEHAMTIIGTWLLPAIYGALGALVYYMRQFMNPLRRDPSGPRVIMRVSLGALAGILLAWFWTTTTVSDSLSVPNVGLGTLSFAFIIGFSIEVFFGFLDRTVQLANESVKTLGSGSR